MKAINPETLFLFQITPSGEISINQCSQHIRVTEEPLPGYEDSRLVREKEIDQVIEDYVNGSHLAHEVDTEKSIDCYACEIECPVHAAFPKP